MKYINPHDFYLETNGKVIDVDGSYGGQCWDLFAYFCQKYCGRTFSCIRTGYVIDLWNTFEQIGLDKYFDKVNILQDGDWAIWQGPCQITSKSHIAMFRLDNGNGTGIFLTQNPNGNPNYVHQMNISYQGIVGGLRSKTNQPKKEYVITEPVAEEKPIEPPKVEEPIIDEKPTEEIIENKPVEESKTEDSPISQEEHITLENGQEEQKIEDNSIELINQDKENPLVEFIKWIIKIIQKLMKGEHHD